MSYCDIKSIAHLIVIETTAVWPYSNQWRRPESYASAKCVKCSHHHSAKDFLTETKKNMNLNHLYRWVTGCHLWVIGRLSAIRDKSGEILFFEVSEKSRSSAKSQGKSLDAGKSRKPWIDIYPYKSFMGCKCVCWTQFIDFAMILFCWFLYCICSVFVIAFHFNDQDNFNVTTAGFRFCWGP